MSVTIYFYAEIIIFSWVIMPTSMSAPSCYSLDTAYSIVLCAGLVVSMFTYYSSDPQPTGTSFGSARNYQFQC